MTPTARRYVATFLLTVAAILSPVYVITGLEMNPYPDPIDFEKIPDGSFLPVNRLSDRYQTSVKLRYAEVFPPPDVGVFGSHVMQFMSQEAMGEGSERVFNYFVTHLGLPEIHMYLRHLEHQRKLPKRLILIGIQNPHTNNFSHISKYIWEFPLELYLLRSDMRITNRVRFTMQRFSAVVRDRLDWRNLVYKLFSGSLFGCRPAYGVQSIALGPAGRKPDVNMLSGAEWLQKLGMRPPATDCKPSRGFRADGSFVLASESPDPNLVPDSSPIKAAALPPGIVPEVVETILKINAIGTRNGRKVVFLVPPYFETPRSSQRYEQLDRIITALPNSIRLIDDRRGFQDRNYFYNRLHPSTTYFRKLLLRLRNHGLI